MTHPTVVKAHSTRGVALWTALLSDDSILDESVSVHKVLCLGHVRLLLWVCSEDELGSGGIYVWHLKSET